MAEATDIPAFEGNERYTIRRPIGGGGMGLVYEAWDRQRKAAVALKTLRTGSPDAVYRLKQEFRALSDLAHPNLVRLHELIGADETWFIAMELIAGRRFLDWVRGDDPDPSSVGHTGSWNARPEHLPDGETPPTDPSPPPDLDRLRAALIQLLRGLAALHAAGKLHRDLKPSNVLVTPEGRVVLVDFGLVYDIDRAASEMSRVDRVVGTAAYMAPEQVRGEPPTEASDLYSVGVMLFQALTGQLPFEGSLLRLLMQKQQEDAPAPSERVSGLPEDLDRLCTSLLAREPDDRPTATEVLATLGDHPDPGDAGLAPLDPRRVEGREVQRQALEESWAHARAGNATLILVRGRSGMGKTGLVRHFLTEVRRHEQATILRSRCGEREEVPFKAFDHLVDGLKRRLDRLPEEERAQLMPDDFAALARVFPVLRPLLAEDAPDLSEAEPGAVRSRAFEALGDLLARLARRRPVIVFLDDLQWGDLDSTRLLSHLLQSLHAARLLVIAAYRTEDEDTSPFLIALRTDPRIASLAPRTLDLEELPDDTATAVARSLLGDALDDPSGAAVWLARESGGSPFLMAEIARALRSAAESGEQPDLARFKVDDVFRQRVDGLDERPRLLMEAVAVAGRPLPLRLLARASGIDGDALDALDPLRVRHLVRSTRGPLGDLVEPYHARIASAVVEAIDPSQRSALHLRLAHAMEAQGWLDPEVLMDHFHEGGEDERAGLLALAAARAAVDTLAFGRAADLFADALTLRDWTDEERDLIEVELADALVYAGRGEEAARVYLDVAAGMSDEAAQPLRRKAAGQLIFAGHVGEGLVHLDGVVKGAGLRVAPASPLWSLAVTRWRRWWLRRHTLDFDPIPEHQVEPALLRQIDTAWHLALGLGLVDPVQCGWYHAVGMRLALQAREPYRVARALSMELPQAVAWGESTPELQARQMRRARQLAVLSGRAHASGLVDFGEGVVAYQEGRWDAARRALNRAHRVFVEQCAGVAFELAATRLYAVKALIWAGRLAEASERRTRLLAEAEEVGNHFLADGLRTDTCVWLSLATGDADGARAMLDVVLGRWRRDAWDQQRFLAWSGEIDRLLWERRPRDAVALLDAGERDVRRAQLHRLGINRRRLADLRGRACVALAHETADLRPLRAAERAAHALHGGSYAAPPLGALIAAGVHAVRGDPDGASDALRQALRGFEEAGMTLHAAVCQDRLGASLPGKEGDRHRHAARQHFDAEQVTHARALVHLLAPGFDDPASDVTTASHRVLKALRRP